MSYDETFITWSLLHDSFCASVFLVYEFKYRGGECFHIGMYTGSVDKFL